MTGSKSFEAVMAALDALDAASGVVIDAEHYKMSRDQRLAISRRLETAARRTDQARVVLAGKHDTAKDAAALGATSTGVMLAQVLRLGRREAGRRVRLARQTRDHIAISGDLVGAPRPHLAEALEAGDVSGEHARIIVEALDDRTLRDVHPHRLDQAEQFLVDQAALVEPAVLDKLATKLLDALNPDGLLDDPTYDPTAHAELRFGERDRRTGLTPISGKLDALKMEHLRRAIDGLAAPQATVEGVRDTRTPGRRNAEALDEALQRLLGTENLPSQHGTKPQVRVIMTLQDLEDRAGRARLLDGTPLTPAQTRTLLCEADILPVVLGGAGEVLDVGRASRFATKPIRTAVEVRDQGCTFPGCDRPPDWCDLHHIIWWILSGETSTENSCLLCPAHHTLIHQSDWRVRLAQDGLPEFIPPRWIDPARKPLRNTLHDPPFQWAS